MPPAGSEGSAPPGAPGAPGAPGVPAAPGSPLAAGHPLALHGGPPAPPARPPDPPPGVGELHIRAGGPISVVGDELRELAASHELLARDLVVVMAMLSAAAETSCSVDPAERFAARAVDLAAGHLAAAHAIASGLPTRLELAAQWYAEVDRIGAAADHAAGDLRAWLLGMGAQVLAVPLSGVALTAAATSTVLAFATTGGDPVGWLKRHPELYTNEAFAGFINQVAEHSDAWFAGFFGLSTGLSAGVLPLLGGTPTAAQVLVKGRLLGTFGETPVRIAQTTEVTAPEPPRRLLEAAQRIQSLSDGAQVLVEKYELPDGSTVANVYVGGTIDWSLYSSDQPWDMTSNVGAVAQSDEVGAAAAVELAMRDAGIDPATPVQLFGFSQGGIQAALVAHRAEFNVVSLVTIGSPAGDIPLDPGIRGLAIGHTEDPVFALGDEQVNPGMVTVTTRRFGDGDFMPPVAAPAHQFGGYVRTIGAVDASADPRVRAVIDDLLARTQGAVASTAVAYRAERVQ